MKTIWCPRYPMVTFFIAEHDHERVWIATVRNAARVTKETKSVTSESIPSPVRGFLRIPKEIFDLARMALDEPPLEQGERAAKALMGDPQMCTIHLDAQKWGCPTCLGVIGVGVDSGEGWDELRDDTDPEREGDEAQMPEPPF
jgi:hypothetical protein